LAKLVNTLRMLRKPPRGIIDWIPERARRSGEMFFDSSRADLRIQWSQ